MRRLASSVLLLLLAGCDRWHVVEPTVLVSAEVAGDYEADRPGLVVVEHGTTGHHEAVGALCGEEGPVELGSHYLIAGCNQPQNARAYAAQMPEDLRCDQDFSENAVLLEEPLEADSVGEWVMLFSDHGDDDGCWAAEGSEVVELEL